MLLMLLTAGAIAAIDPTDAIDAVDATDALHAIDAIGAVHARGRYLKRRSPRWWV